ncbi:ras gtpase-activating protein [Anaeramoeba flamelloides]|uniref:Ras gtpase-activating protein n=1 Tax=Anaeramoeba flamelloides TaxID=1746091 RepID=A0ABQ8Z1Q3_9EUKA|nr:ras gtpase-activating protein [Anaeramoeba flamelloides]
MKIIVYILIFFFSLNCFVVCDRVQTDVSLSYTFQKNSSNILIDHASSLNLKIDPSCSAEVFRIFDGETAGISFDTRSRNDQCVIFDESQTFEVPKIYTITTWFTLQDVSGAKGDIFRFSVGNEYIVLQAVAGNYFIFQTGEDVLKKPVDTDEYTIGGTFYVVIRKDESIIEIFFYEKGNSTQHYNSINDFYEIGDQFCELNIGNLGLEGIMFDFYSFTFYNKYLSNDEIEDNYRDGEKYFLPTWYDQTEQSYSESVYDQSRETITVIQPPTTYSPDTDTQTLIITSSPPDGVQFFATSDGDTAITDFPWEITNDNFEFYLESERLEANKTFDIDYYWRFNDKQYGTVFRSADQVAKIELYITILDPVIESLSHDLPMSSIECSEIEVIDVVDSSPGDDYANVQITSYDKLKGTLFADAGCETEVTVDTDYAISGTRPDYSRKFYYQSTANSNNEETNQDQFSIKVITDFPKESNVAQISLTMTNQISQSSSDSFHFNEDTKHVESFQFEDFTTDNDWEIILGEIVIDDMKSNTSDAQLRVYKHDESSSLSTDDIIFSGINNSEIDFMGDTDLCGDITVNYIAKHGVITKALSLDVTIDCLDDPSTFVWDSVTTGDDDEIIKERLQENATIEAVKETSEHQIEITISTPDLQVKLEIKTLYLDFTFGEEEEKRTEYTATETVSELNKKISNLIIHDREDDEHLEGKLMVDIYEAVSGEHTANGELTITYDYVQATPTPKEDEKESLVVMLGGILGGVGGLLIIILIIFLVRHKRKNRRPQLPPPPDFEEYMYGKVLGSEFTKDQLIQIEKMERLIELILEEDSDLLDAITNELDPSDSETISKAFVMIFEKEEKFFEIFRNQLQSELDKTTKATVLFRNNSLVSKMMKHYSFLVGLPYLYRTLGYEIFEIINEEGKELEVNVTKIDSDEDEDQVEINRWLLLGSTQKILTNIMNSTQDCPYPFRYFCNQISERVGKKFEDSVNTSIGGFIFLRVFSPAITTPEAYGLIPDTPSDNARRHLVLIAKVLQNVANGTNFREESMKNLKTYIDENKIKAYDWFKELSQLPEEVPEMEPIEIPQNVLDSSYAAVHRVVSRNHKKILKYLENEVEDSKELIEEFNSLLEDIGEPLKKKVTII